MYDIHPKYGIPREMISCPGCGKVYTGKICLNCEECSKCCTCKKDQQILISANRAKQHISEHELLQDLLESEIKKRKTSAPGV